MAIGEQVVLNYGDAGRGLVGFGWVGMVLVLIPPSLLCYFSLHCPLLISCVDAGLQCANERYGSVQCRLAMLPIQSFSALTVTFVKTSINLLLVTSLKWPQIGASVDADVEAELHNCPPNLPPHLI